VKKNPKIDRLTPSVAGLDRLKRLETQLASTPVDSPRRGRLSAAIHSEAAAYRKSLDAEQAMATHDIRPQPAVARGMLYGVVKIEPQHLMIVSPPR
jgi:hypothetical protein